MKLYVTRHGETPMNAAHRVCGLTNIDLTEKGIAQAKEAGRSLQDKGIKRIIASPLLRAQHTARLIADEIGIDTIETEQRLIEQNYGIYENTDWDGEAFNANKREFAVRYPGGESMLDLAGRLAFKHAESLKRPHHAPRLPRRHLPHDPHLLLRCQKHRLRRLQASKLRHHGV